jgi:hypothetical protein
MKQINLRLDDEQHAHLVAAAKRDRRSLNAEIEWCIDRALSDRPAGLELSDIKAGMRLRSYNEETGEPVEGVVEDIHRGYPICRTDIGSFFMADLRRSEIVDTTPEGEQ